MTKKHFEALAAALRAERPGVNCDEDATHVWEASVYVVEDVCARFNPHFDRTRFLKTCGVEEDK